MRYLRAVEQTTHFLFRVHMDETKNRPDGTPDPAYILEYSWFKEPPAGQTRSEYLTNIKREIGLLVARELERKNPTSTDLVGFD